MSSSTNEPAAAPERGDEAARPREGKRRLTAAEIEGVIEYADARMNANVKQALRAQLEGVQIYPSKIEALREFVMKKYVRSRAAPATMVGAISATSIGEPITQLCVRGDEHVVVAVGGRTRDAPIGRIVDEIIDEVAPGAPRDESVVVPLAFAPADRRVMVKAVARDGSVAWRAVTEASRHPPRGDLVRVTTERGRTATATLAHSFLRRAADGTIEPVLGRDVAVGDRVPVLRGGAPPPPGGGVDPQPPTGAAALARAAELGLVCSRAVIVNRGALVVRLDLDLVRHAAYSATCARLARDVRYDHARGRLRVRGALVAIGGAKRVPDEMFGARRACVRKFLAVLIENNARYDRRAAALDLEFDSEAMAAQVLYLLAGRFDLGARADPRRVGARVRVGGVRYRNELVNLLIAAPGLRAETGGFACGFERVAAVERVPEPAGECVYDLSVARDATFCLRSGIFIHNTLNTFHNSGSSQFNVTLGIPRLNELFNASRKQKTRSARVRLAPRLRGDLRAARRAFAQMAHAQLLDLVARAEILHRFRRVRGEADIGRAGARKAPHGWYAAFHAVHRRPPPAGDWCLRFALDRRAMRRRRLRPADVARRIEAAFVCCQCVWSPTHLATVDVFVDTSFLKPIDSTNSLSPHDMHVLTAFMKAVGDHAGVRRMDNRRLVDIIHDHADDAAALEDGDVVARVLEDVDAAIAGGGEPAGGAVGGGATYINDHNKYFYFLKDICKERLYKTKLCGIDGVRDAFFVKEGAEWVVHTDGIDAMRDVFVRFADRVEFSETFSNDIWDIFATLGIEAVVAFLTRELEKIISFGGTYIHPCHIQLLVDEMTHAGNISSVNRYGIKSSSSSVLTKASFEQSLENIVNATFVGERDKLESVSSNIICGKMCRLGTGYFDLKMDLGKIMHTPHSESAE